ncbi:MAG: amidohydrolase family protein [Pseudomonadales bacterium]|nr:amidohydrolase family protein [Pseudomonadales bacterium]
MTILTNLKIIDPVLGLVDADAIEVENGVIVALGTAGEMPGPDRRDMGGVFVTPGLIDAHVHLCLNPEISNPLDQDKFDRETLMAQMIERARQMLDAGITTARDLGGGQWIELDVRDAILSGEVAGPRLLCSGQPITSVSGHCHFWGGEASDVTEALAVLERQVEHGVDLIKVMATGGNLTKGSTPKDAQFDTATLTSVVQAAGNHGMHVAAHCHGTAGIANAATAGVRTIEHCSWVGDAGWARNYDAAVAEEIVRRGAIVSPTINLGWKRRIGSGEYEELVKGNFARLRALGAGFITSTDAGIPNVFHHHLGAALPIFAHFTGMSNAEVLRAATIDCATAIGIGDRVGRIARGFAADLVFLEADPLEDLATFEAPAAVMARGTIAA